MVHLGRTQYVGILTWHLEGSECAHEAVMSSEDGPRYIYACTHNLRLGGIAIRDPFRIMHHGTGKRPPVAELTTSEPIKALRVSSKPRSPQGSIAAGDGKDEMTSED